MKRKKDAKWMDGGNLLTLNVLRDIRRAMRALRRAEAAIMREHRAMKRALAKSDEWNESARIRDADLEAQFKKGGAK